MQCQTVMSNKAVKERRFRQREKQRKRFESPMRKFIEVKYPNIFQEYTELYNTLNRNHPDVTEEVGQAGRKASWVPVPNCARGFIDSLAVVE